jgi:hypothetical protein
MSRSAAREHMATQETISNAESSPNFVTAPLRWYHIASLILILLLAFTLRWATEDYQLGEHGDDGISEYAVAYHAIQYGEWPTVGASTGTFPDVRSSVGYYYFLIALEAIDPSIWFVTYAYVLLLSSVALGVFLLVRPIYGNTPALLAALVASLTNLDQTQFLIWQSNFMEPFVVFSLVTLLYSYSKKSLGLFIASNLLMLFACAVHYSGLAVLPIYIVLCLWIARRMFDPWEYQKALAVTLFAALLLFGSSLAAFASSGFYLAKDSSNLYSGPDATIFRTLSSFIGRYGMQIPTSIHVGIRQVLFVAFIALVIWYLCSSVPQRQKIYIYVVLGFLASDILASIVIAPGESRFFGPAVWVIPVLVAAVTSRGLLFRSDRFPAAAFFVAPLLYALASAPLVASALANVPTFNRPNEHVIAAGTAAITDEVQNLRTQYQYPDYRFFDLYVLTKDTRSGRSNQGVILWQGLEKTLGAEFVRVGNDGIGVVSVLNSNEVDGGRFRFLVCMNLTPQYVYSRHDCLQRFAWNNPDYGVQKAVFDTADLTIYLASRN